MCLSGFALGSRSIASAEGVRGGRGAEAACKVQLRSPSSDKGGGADQGCILQEEDSAEYSAAVLAMVQEALEHLQRPPSA